MEALADGGTEHRDWRTEWREGNEGVEVRVVRSLSRSELRETMVQRAEALFFVGNYCLNQN
jgi:hypothetical protein